MAQERLELKTEQEVVDDFCRFIREGAIGQTITGEVYPYGRRPVDSEAEDAVVLWAGGEDTLLQHGTVTCNIYVKDDDMCLAWERNSSRERIGELEQAVRTFVREFRCEDYYQIETRDTATVEKEALRGQHYIHVRFLFSRRAS